MIITVNHLSKVLKHPHIFKEFSNKCYISAGVLLQYMKRCHVSLTSISRGAVSN